MYHMLKQSLLALVAASLISLAIPYAAAQDNSSGSSGQTTTDQQSQPSQGYGRHHHGPPDPAKHTEMLTKKLKLTSDQQSKIQEIFQSEASQMQSLHQDSSTSQQDRHAKMMDIHNNTNTQVRALLDPNQQKKWDAMQARREERMERHNGGQSNGAQQAPPSQQQ
jgi:Spy/CpxP family protein refolding chaperone